MKKKAIMVCFEVNYLGTTVVDRRFSSPMVPWVIADIRRRKKVTKVTLVIEEQEIKGICENDRILFRHNVQKLVRFCCDPNNVKMFLYLVREDSDPLLHCFLYSASDLEDVMEILQTMKESSREHTNWQAPTKSYSSAASLTALCPDISVSNSQFFEVLYVGKIKVSHRNVPQTFIDDALEKINIYVKKSKKADAKAGNLTKTLSLEGNDNGRSRSNVEFSENDKKILSTGNSASGSEDENGTRSNRKLLKPSFSHDDIHNKIKLEHSMKIIDNSSTCDTADNCGRDSFPEEPANVIKEDDIRRVNHEMGFRRARAGSLGVLETFKRKTDDYNHNRTMLFYVGKTDLILISPDRKQVLFNKKLKDIVGCVQGLQYNEHFGFICREDECFIGYLFKCECENVADDIVSVITQSFRSNKEMRDLKQPVLSCEHCPMVWFHNLCSDIEGMNDKKTQAMILRKIETLPSEEQEIIQAKFLGTESSNIKEQNEFLIILLRTHCETKQTRHVHDTAENRSEFLNHYLGGSTIFTKAKRSLTSSFDQLLKRKGSQLDNLLQHSQSKELNTKRSNPSLHEIDGNESQKSYGTENGKKFVKSGSSPNEIEQLKNHFHKDKSTEEEKKAQGKKHSFQEIAAITINNQKIERNLLQTNAEEEEEEEDGGGGGGIGIKESESPKTPMMNIFLKVGSTTKSPENDKFFVNEVNETPSGSWRQVIFNRVVTPGKCESAEEKVVRTRTREELRDLWKKAINQQLLLIRMEKENARLKARQEEATVKRIKLEYDDLGSMNKEYIGIWEMISSKDSRLISSKCDQQMLLQAIRQGVPPAKRGDVWHFLAVQYCLKQPPFNSTDFPNYEVPYEDLLKQLTSFQHAILIDLGRTFPNHPYFSSPLGPGQLALFNLLKAYSLLDPQVGYCQGLSFIAGVLLLHMSEEAAFLLLKHLMFRRGIRRQFLPDMAALQVQLYQLTRLLYDTLPRLYAHFDRNEIAPTLYAAPWMLTLFASQFPLGFVTRVFDLLFLEHTTDIIFRVILALLEEHMESLLASSTFEEIMSYLKNEIPKMSGVQVEKIMKRVLIMDVSKRLREYEVEYHVLQEEMLTPRPKLEELKKLEFENKRLTEQNTALLEQLEIVNKNSNLLERSRSTQQSIINRLEAQIRNLEITIAALGGFISEACERHKEIIVPGEVRRIISNLEVSESRGSNQGGAKRVPDRSAMLKKSHTSMGFTEKDGFFRADTLLSELQNGSRFAAKSESVDAFNKRDRSRPNSLRGVPLKVIVDEDDEERKKIGGNTSNITSKITSGVSLFFNSSQNHGKNNKSKMFMQDNMYNCDSRPGECCNNENQPTRSFSNEIDTLHISGDPVVSGQKETLMRDCKANCASDLTNAKTEMPPVSFHPLDACNDVNITYNGPTKLKSIKSGHKLNRSNTTISCE